jgi:predicted RNA-binding protein with RPS1 domain
MKLGKVMKAIVRRVEEYGSFVELVDLPGVSGLVRLCNAG